MTNSKIHYLLRQPDAHNGFKTGVSLHSHTMHSKESTSFVVRLARKSKWFRWFIHRQLYKFSELYGEEMLTDLQRTTDRMWWTSPLSGSQAFKVEKGQIGEKLGLTALVSLTDHDNIDAPTQLQMVADNTEAPVSVEWTTPYLDTYFHLGVHNLAPQTAAEYLARMHAFTANPDPSRLRGLFHELCQSPDVLIILNHPYWDQPWHGAERHEALLKQFAAEYRPYIHALEINGLRSWTENRKVVRMSKETGFPLISGGDRHGCEPNATLNLTNAATFAEFVAEIRGGAQSQLLVMPQFHDPLLLRVLLGLRDVLKDHPEHALGWTRWSERVFRHCKSDDIKTFADFFEGKEPFWMGQIMRFTHMATSPRMRPAWRRMAIPAEDAL